MKKLFFFILLVIGASYFFLIARFNVLSLRYSYPVWNYEKSQYELARKKPKTWIDLNSLSEEAKWAIVISEDWAFYDHLGVDFRQLEIVLRQSIKEGRLVRGASTITQQVIKNSLLTQDKSIIRKIKEVFLSVLLEYYFTKDEILELYINIIELGDGIYGVQNASYFYFKKPPLKLNAKEGAFLAMLLPSPKRYAQSYRDKKLTKFASEQVQKILLKLRMAKKIDEKRRRELMNFRFNFVKEEVLEILPEFDSFY